MYKIFTSLFNLQGVLNFDEKGVGGVDSVVGQRIEVRNNNRKIFNTVDLVLHGILRHQHLIVLYSRKKGEEK